jgi:NOL1/NOP2/fmu family ribosome biogenesis protein
MGARPMKRETRKVIETRHGRVIEIDQDSADRWVAKGAPVRTEERMVTDWAPVNEADGSDR